MFDTRNHSIQKLLSPWDLRVPIPLEILSQVLRQLIGEGLDLEVTNTGGHTLLQLAQERGKEHCAQVLLREGAGRTQCLAFSGKLVSYRIVRIVSESCPNLTYSSGGQKL